MPPRGRVGLLLPVRCARLGHPGDVAEPRPRRVHVRLARATAPTSRATTSCSTGRRTTPPTSSCSTSSRSATRASSPASPDGSAARKPIVAVRSGRSSQGVPMGHAVRKIARCRREAVDAMFRQAGMIQVESLEEMFDVAQLLAHQPLPRGRRVAIVGNSDALGLLAADAANSVGLVVNKQVALGATPPPRTSRTRSTARSTTRRSTPSSRSSSRRSTSPAPARTSPTCSPRRRAVRQAHRLHVPRHRGRPGAAAGPDVAGSVAGPRIRAVVPRRRGGGACARARRRVRRLAARAQRRSPTSAPPTTTRRATWSTSS